MRFCGLLVFGLTLVGMSGAQDSNFSTGPQYLLNYGSPMFMRPIATPTLSLSESTMPAALATPEASSSSHSAGASSVEVGSARVAAQPDLASIYWGSGEGATPVESGAVIEISGTTPPAGLPASILNVGVEETVDAQELRLRGYGVSVSEASAFWKVHKPHAVRVLTNRDVEKFHGE